MQCEAAAMTTSAMEARANITCCKENDVVKEVIGLLSWLQEGHCNGTLHGSATRCIMSEKVEA